MAHSAYLSLLGRRKRAGLPNWLGHAARWSYSTQSNELPLDVPSVCVWGANTGVGKTLISAGLARAALRNGVRRLLSHAIQWAA